MPSKGRAWRALGLLAAVALGLAAADAAVVSAPGALCSGCSIYIVVPAGPAAGWVPAGWAPLTRALAAPRPLLQAQGGGGNPASGQSPGVSSTGTGGADSTSGPLPRELPEAPAPSDLAGSLGGGEDYLGTMNAWRESFLRRQAERTAGGGQQHAAAAGVGEGRPGGADEEWFHREGESSRLGRLLGRPEEGSCGIAEGARCARCGGGVGGGYWG